jgi:GTP pyrophosphokinase
LTNNLILKAAAVAAEAHAEQKRKVSGDPYINHLIRVAFDASTAGLSDEAIAAAFLHDVVEDTHVSFDELSLQFAPRVVTLVRLLTKWWPDDADKELKRSEKPKYYGAILNDQEAIELKLLDRADNLRDMANMLPKAKKWAERYFEKTEDELTPLQQLSTNKKAQEIYTRALNQLRKKLLSDSD